MLHDACMKTESVALDRLSVRVEAFVADALKAIDHATQARHRQAAFPALFHGRVQRRDDRVDQDRLRNRLGLWVTLAALEAEDHQLQVNADLRGSKAHAADAFHGFEHVGDEGLEFVTAEHRLRYGRSDAKQALVAHFQDLVNHEVSPFKDSALSLRGHAIVRIRFISLGQRHGMIATQAGNVLFANTLATAVARFLLALFLAFGRHVLDDRIHFRTQ